MDDEDDVDGNAIGDGNSASSTSAGHIHHSHHHPQHAICIETEADIEPTSPKMFTESSSKWTKENFRLSDK